MKKIILNSLIILGLLLSYMLFLSGFVKYSSSAGITPIDPIPYEKTEVYHLYFIYEDRLIAEERLLDSSREDIEKRLLDELFKGSKIDLYKSPLNKNIQVLNMGSKDRVLYINLSDNFLEKDKKLLVLKVMSIVSTFSQLNFIDKVDFQINGEDILVDYIKLGDSSYYQNIITEEDKLANKFLEYFDLNRFDLIYELLSKKETEYINYNMFLDDILRIKKMTKDKEYINKISIMEDDRYYVRFLYTKGYYFDVYIENVHNEYKVSFIK